METLIQFRSFCAELTDKEFNQFIIQTIRSQGRDLFTQLFFNNFKSNPNKIIPLTNIITEIINSRDKKPNQQYLCNKIDELPSSLIGNCASYLNTNDYFNFGKVNRKIYISCYTPCKLYRLSYKLFRKYPLSLSMERLKTVNELMINIKHFNRYLSQQNKQMWCGHNSFEYLCISNKGCDENDAEKFFNSKIIENNNFRTIVFSYFGLTTAKFNTSVFRYVLSHLSHIEKLFFNQTYINNDHITDNEIKQWLPNIKHFGLADRRCARIDNMFVRRIIRYIGHNMESISLGTQIQIDVPLKGFCKLEQLALSVPTMNVLNAFKDVKTLKRVFIASNEMDSIKLFISRMIKEQLLLEYLQININARQLKDIMEYVENSLLDCTHCRNKTFSEYKRLCIRIHCSELKHDIINGVYIRIIRIINALNIAGVKQFRLSFRMDLYANFDKESNEMNEWSNDIDNMKQNYLIHYECNKKTIQFVVSNIGCLINGYYHNFYEWM